MANKKRNVYKPKPMIEEKRIQGMLESEMNEHLGYNKYECSEESNYHNGLTSKMVRSKYNKWRPHESVTRIFM